MRPGKYIFLKCTKKLKQNLEKNIMYFKTVLVTDEKLNKKLAEVVH